MEKVLISAKKTLEKGGLIIFPTETVYGIGGDATNYRSIKKIFKIKNRPLSNPLICHFSNLRRIKENFELSELENIIATKYWPGPLTLILKKKIVVKLLK
jgi:L-threonylcarbamoyladenylate synthase